MSAEENIKQEMGELASADDPMPLRHLFPSRADTDTRLTALEINIQAIYRGVLRAGREIDDLRKTVGGSK